MNIDVISVEAAIAITERSRSTWWRRIGKGEVTRVDDDSRGRAMLPLSDVIPQVCVPMTPIDLNFVVRADAGDTDAQNDIGQFFSNAGKHKVALYWLQQAVDKGNPDAMQWLGRCYLGGDGVEKDEHLGLMWIAKAAAHGHLVALRQMKGLLDR